MQGADRSEIRRDQQASGAHWQNARRLAETDPWDRKPLNGPVPKSHQYLVAEETETVRRAPLVPDMVQVTVPALVVVVPQVREVDVVVVNVLPAIAYAIPSAPRPLESLGVVSFSAKSSLWYRVPSRSDVTKCIPAHLPKNEMPRQFRQRYDFGARPCKAHGAVHRSSGTGTVYQNKKAGPE